MKNYSKQREEIIKIIEKLCSYPTAEEIYMLAKTKDPAISRSTVYRNLALLSQNNIINKIPMNNGICRYDYRKENNNYIICRKCYKIEHFNYNFENTKLKNIIKELTQMEILNDGIAIEGICKDCKD